MTSTTAMLALGYLMGASIWVGGIYLVDRYRRWSRPTILNCPSGHEPAALDVRFDPMADPPGLRVTRCSHWPRQAGCQQQCIAEAVRRRPSALCA